MIYRMMIAAAAVGTAAAAQPPSTAAPSAAPAVAEAPDEARRAAAHRLVETSMPPEWVGQIARIIAEQAGFGDMVPDPALARRDRHFAERTRLTRAAVETEALRILRAEEPGLRAVTTDFFARRLSLEDLEAANLFYSSPAGQRLRSSALALASDPDYAAGVRNEIAPLGAAVMERAARRFIEETASLPPFAGADDRAVPVRVAVGAVPVRPVVTRRVAPAPEPERLAAAQRMLEAMWAPEAMNVPTNLDPVLDALLAMRMATFGVPFPPEWEIAPDATVADLAGRFDPAFRERARIAIRVWAEEYNRSNAEAAPIYKRILADFYARSFTVAEIDEFTRFLSGPAGSHLRQASVGMYDDPQFVAYFARLLPRLVSQMVPAFERIQAATAHLPPPPPPRRERRRR